MPNRIIKESIHTSPNLNNLSDLAERHFYRLLTLADDHGCFEATPSVIKGRCYSLKPKITAAKVEKWQGELTNVDIIRLWSDNGRIFGIFVTFAKHQRVRSLHRRKTPAPPEQVFLPADTWRQLTTSDRLYPLLLLLPNPILIPNPVEEGTEPDDSGSIPAELQGLNLYEGDMNLCKKLPTLMIAWKDAFPGVDIIAEIKKAHAWEVSNPTKVKKNRPRFLQNWLSRAQDKPRGGPQDGKGGKDIGRSFAGAEKDTDKFRGR